MPDNITVAPQGDPEETLEIPWAQQPNEPDNWYQRFFKYYLALGPSRTLLRAVLDCVRVEEPERFEEYLFRPPQSARKNWVDMSAAWQWRLRARAYDQATSQRAMRSLDQARDILIENTVKAANTLVDSLENPRTRVPAAKEILDRGGLPGAVERITRVLPFSADELAEARRQVDEWQNQISESNG